MGLRASLLQKKVRFPAYPHTFASGSLAELDLTDNNIGDAGAKAIADAIGASGSLAELFLGQNQIGDAGAKELARAISASGSLARLSLAGNNIGAAGVKAIAEAIRASGSLALKTLWVSSNLAELVAACKSKGVKLNGS